MRRILLIDNYDSFTYNLYHYLEELNNGQIGIMRNDEIDFQRIDSFDGIVISPGPGLPSQAGDLMKVITKYAGKKRILGVCLGLQAIAEHFGMKLNNLVEVVHGQASFITQTSSKDILFQNLPLQFKVGRYHSWVIDSKSKSKDILFTSKDEKGTIMSMQHKTLPINAVQFHPESILTEHGKKMIENWLKAF